jgi:hypothetical protein
MTSKVLFSILLLASALYASAQQPALQAATQPAAQLGPQPGDIEGPYRGPRTASLPNQARGRQIDLQSGAQLASQLTPQPASQPLPSAAYPLASQAAPQLSPQQASQADAHSAQSSVQAPPAGSDWKLVEALPAGAILYLNAKGGHKRCKVESVTADALTCTGRNAVYPRTDIWSIKIGHRMRSALEAAIPGFVIAAAGGISFAAENCSNQQFFSFCGVGPAAAVAGGAAIAIIGAGIGALTDFSKSTIYTAP